MADLKFIACTQTQFNALLSANPPSLTEGALYFTTDTYRIYRATSTSAYQAYSLPYKIDTSFPSSGQEQGRLYINSSTYEVRCWNGSAWVVLSPPLVTSITAESTNAQIPSAKAVYDAIPKTGTTSGTVPVLDANGKLSNSVMPDLAISKYIGTVSAKSSLTTLSTAEIGDFAIVSGDSTAGNDGSYILNGEYGTLSNWVQISTPDTTVSIDQTIIENSSNAVAGGAVYTALAGKAPSSHTHTTSDITSGLATVATTGNYNDLTTKLQWSTIS